MVLASVSNVAGKVAFKMMQFYPGNKTGGIPGLFGDPYYWWEAGAVFGVSLYSILFILFLITQPSTPPLPFPLLLPAMMVMTMMWE